MSEEFVPKGPGVTRVGIETTFATVAGTMDAAFPLTAPELTFDQTALRIQSESANMFDSKGHKKTLKSGSKGKIGFAMRCHASRLVSGASGITTPPNMHILRAILGGERILAGTTIGTVTDGNAFNVADGTKLKPYVPALFERTSGNFEIGVPESIATNAVTMRFDLSGSPLNTTGKVVNLAAWYPTQTNTKSFSIEAVDALSDNTMRRALGCTGGLKVSFKREELITYESDVMIADWDEGSDLGIPTSIQTDSQGDHFSMDGAHCIMQATGTHTRGFVNLYDVEVELMPGMVHRTNTAGNGVQNVLGTMRTPPDEGVFVKITPRFYYDRDLETAWDSGMTVQFGVFSYSGTGNNMRVCGFYCPKMLLAKKPVREEEGKILMLKCELEGMLNTSGSDDLERAQIIFVAG